jgi:hypothetical protein
MPLMEPAIDRLNYSNREIVDLHWISVVMARSLFWRIKTIFPTSIEVWSQIALKENCFLGEKNAEHCP